MKKIILYGGTFDPPHNAHIKMLKDALKEINPARVYLIPSWKSPFKDFSWAGFKERAEMIKIALKESDFPKSVQVKIHPFEAKRKRVTYTYQTLNYFAKFHKGEKLYFLMGSDCYDSFEKWKKRGEITKKANLLVGKRKGFDDAVPRRYKAVFLKGIYPEISSSRIRKALFLSGYSADIAESVLSFIKRKKLYLQNAGLWMEKNMSRARLRHSFETAKLAARLAEKNGIDADKAAAAALLHDCARDFPPEKLKKIVSPAKKSIPRYRKILKKAPVVFHSYASALIAEKKFGVKDSEILKAIKSHAAPSLSTSVLDKIIFVSDLAGFDRKMPFSAKLRKEAFKNLDSAFKKALNFKIRHIKESGAIVF